MTEAFYPKAKNATGALWAWWHVCPFTTSCYLNYGENF